MVTERAPADTRPSARQQRLGLGSVVAVCSLLLVGLFLANAYHYLLFHALVELFSIIIAVSIFVIGYNARDLIENEYLAFLGVAYLSVAVLDLAHVLAYKGMGIFPGSTANLATQLWIGARGVESVSLLVAPCFLRWKLGYAKAFAAYSFVTAALLVSIFVWPIFPVCLVEGVGLTSFKTGGEYAMVAILLAAGLHLHRHRADLDLGVWRLSMASIAVTIASELAFTRYVDPYGLSNQLGHVLKLISFYLIYRAIIETGLRRPFALLFRELKQREEALERSNLELEGYAHTVSHDLKNPLAVIISSADGLKLLLQQPLTERSIKSCQHLLDNMQNSGEQAVRLIDELLALAEAGQEPAAVERVDVDQVVSRIVSEHSADLSATGSEVQVDGTLGQITAAPSHVYQLFSNLIGNAIAHNPGRRVVIHVGQSGSANDGVHQYFVSDDGKGIAPEHLSKIFLPFYKGDPEGSGVGLSTVEKIVRAYGGRIAAYSEDGARFELTLRDHRPAISSAGRVR